MYKKKLSIFTLIIIILLFKFETVYAKKNKILFKINNEIITTIDMIQETRYLINTNKNLENTKTEMIYEIAKKTLIRNKIKEIEVVNKLGNINLDKKIVIDLLLKQFKKKSEKELDVFFNENKIDKVFVVNKVKYELLWNDLIVSKYFQKVKIDTDQIKKDLKNKSKEKEYLLSEIFFSLENNENLKEKLNAINEVIVNNNFSEAALIFSISNSSEKGGNIGWIKENSLNNKIKEKLNQIDKGNITDPIVIPGGFLLLKINDIRVVDIKINSNEEIKKISQKKTQEQLEQFSVIYFNKVKKNFNINEY